jgi:6-phosphogluconolactonase
VSLVEEVHALQVFEAMADIRVFPDKDKLVQAAAELIVRLASEALAMSGRFSLALSGGSTPRPLYAILATEPFARQVDWSLVHVFWGDERCVPPDDPRSNYQMAREALLDLVPTPADHIHRIRGEDDPELAANDYERELRAFFGQGKKGAIDEAFDLVLLGMGEDGHTASLFPWSRALAERTRWAMPGRVDAASMWRITLTPVVINAAKNVTFLVSGNSKAQRLRDVIEGSMQPELLPAQAINPAHGRLIWLLDEAAAGGLTRVP